MRIPAALPHCIRPTTTKKWVAGECNFLIIRNCEAMRQRLISEHNLMNARHSGVTPNRVSQRDSFDAAPGDYDFGFITYRYCNTMRRSQRRGEILDNQVLFTIVTGTIHLLAPLASFRDSIVQFLRSRYEKPFS